MKTRKHKQWGGSKTKYSTRDKRNLAGVGFTRNQIQFLNNIKQTYGLENLNADGIVYLINENADEELDPTSYTAFYENKYKEDAFTDSEDDTDTNNETYGGRNKSKTRKRVSSMRRKIYKKTHKHIRHR